MKSTLRSLFFIPLYLRIFTNRMELTRLDEQGDAVTLERSFSSVRMLIHDYEAAENAAQEAIGQLFAGHPKLKPKSISIMVQPMELLEGGLSGLEERALLEIGYGAGANTVILTDVDVDQAAAIKQLIAA